MRNIGSQTAASKNLPYLYQNYTKQSHKTDENEN